MWPLVTYSYHFEIVSTVTKESGTVGVFLFNPVILYHYNQGTCNNYLQHLVFRYCNINLFECYFLERNCSMCSYTNTNPMTKLH